MYKQVILVRKDLGMSKGKLAAQCSHAAVESVLNSDKKKIKLWHDEGMKKIVLEVNDRKELYQFKSKATKEKLKTALIKDAGHTELKPGTETCLAIGPDEESKIDKITGHLKVL